MKTALTVVGAIGFWLLAYLCAWYYPHAAPVSEGMSMLLFFTGMIMFCLFALCLGQLVFWRIAQIKKELKGR